MQATTSGSTSGSVVDDDDDDANARPATAGGAAGEPAAGSNASGAAVASVLAHHVYGGARPGSLRNVYVRVTYTDGTRSDGFVPSETLGPENRALLDYMSRRKEGAKIIKYLPEESQRLVRRRTE